jgi:hypothetical protein
MLKHATMVLAALVGLRLGAPAQPPNPTAQAYQSPADCIAG